MTATPEPAALQDLCVRLNGAGIAYMPTGSLAMRFYARSRMTRDVKLLLDARLDRAYLDRWVAQVGLDECLREVRDE